MKGTTRTLLIVLAMATILATVTVGAAVAGKCGHGNNPHCSGGGGTSGGGGGSFSLAMVNDLNGNGLPNYGDSVTFNVSTTVSQPWVQLTCYKDGDTVLNGFVGFYAGYPWAQYFALYTWKWTGGAADCNARLFDGSNDATLATMSFHVDA